MRRINDRTRLSHVGTEFSEEDRVNPRRPIIVHRRDATAAHNASLKPLIQCTTATGTKESAV